MKPPYDECKHCVATTFCPRYKGEQPRPASPQWCNPKYRLDRALRLSEIPANYREANMYTFKVDADNKGVFNGLKPYLDNIVEVVEEEGTNFFFFNKQTGTGKTFSACMVLNQYIYKTCLTSRMDFENPLGLFISYPELMNKLRYERDDDETFALVDKVKEAPILLLDDIGAGSITDFSNEQTYLILNHRFNNKRSTIITSNFDLETLKQLIGKPTVSRILSNCIGVDVGGKDRRRGTFKGVIR